MSVPPLEPIHDLAFARATLAAFTPPDALQAEFQHRILSFVDAHPADAHLRTCLPGHLTASCLLMSATRERVLLHHHGKLDKWLQFGGHCDGDGNLRHVAWRETWEESGIQPEWISGTPVDLDIHPIPARPGEPLHEHLDVRFLASAPAGATERISSESKELRWFRPAEARDLDLDPSLTRLFDLAFV